MTADGEHVRASANEHPELFWALRGGGGSFGVVTAFAFRLHTLEPEVFAGLALSSRRPRARAARPSIATLCTMRRRGSAWPSCTSRPGREGIPEHLHGELVVAIAGMYAGPLDVGREAVREIRAAGAVADFFEPMPYADFQCMIDDPPATGTTGRPST